MSAPTFKQTLPDGDWVLDLASRASGQLIYVEKVTGRTVLVPNVWYNQPVEWRIEVMRFYAERSAGNAFKLRQQREPWAQTEAANSERQADRLNALADEMTRTGKVLA